MNILLIANKAERDLDQLELIRDNILKLHPDYNVKVVVIYTKPFIELLQFSPNLILTYPFTVRDHSLLFYLFKFFLDCSICIYATEGNNLSYMTYEYINKDDYDYELIDREINWGRDFSNSLEYLSIRMGKLREGVTKIAGYVKYEIMCDHLNAPSVHSLSDDQVEKITSYPKEKTLLFFENFTFADYSEQDIKNAGDILHQTDEHDAIKCAIKQVQNVDGMRKLWVQNIWRLATENPDILFINKLHPVSITVINRKKNNPFAQLEDLPNVMNISCSHLDNSWLMKNAGLFIHAGSTSVMESYLFDLPSVFICANDYFTSRNRFTRLHSTDEFAKMHRIDQLDLPCTAFAENYDHAYHLISEHLSGIAPIRFEFDHRIEEIMARRLNFFRDKPYKPSMEIAKILCEPNIFQPLSSSNMMLARAFNTDNGKSFMVFLINYLQKVPIEQNNFALLDKLIYKLSVALPHIEQSEFRKNCVAALSNVCSRYKPHLLPVT